MVNIFERFKFISEAGEDPTTDFTSAIIDAAIKGEHQEMEFIKSISEYQTAKLLKIALKKLNSGFKSAINKLYNTYIENLKSGIDDLNLLITIRTFNKCLQYYTEELKTVKDMLEEYEEYFLCGHIISSLCGEERNYRDMYDFRYEH